MQLRGKVMQGLEGDKKKLDVDAVKLGEPTEAVKEMIRLMQQENYFSNDVVYGRPERRRLS